MRRVLHSRTAALVVAVGCIQSSMFLSAAEPDFFVAVDGKDTNPGTAAAPFGSVARARDAVREIIRAGLHKNIIVRIHGGTYQQAHTLTFGPEDSGTEKLSITYAAAPGEKVVLSGGRRIHGWKKGTGEIWTTEISPVSGGTWYFRQLFIDGQRATRARLPNQGWCEGRPVRPIVQEATDQNVVIKIDVDGGVANWGNPNDIELAYIRNNDGGRKKLQFIDTAAQTVTLQPPHRWAPKCFGQDWYNGVPDGRCYLENALEFLDSPGEWYLDRTTNVLSYWPRRGEDLTTCETWAPFVPNTLLAIGGTRQKPVVNLHFHGLHVEHVDWPLPDIGYMGLFSGNVPEYHEGTDPGHRFIDAAAEIQHARACSFRDGGIARVGGMGLVIRDGTADIAVEGNHIQQTGGGGIGLGQCNVAGGYTKAAPPPEAGEYERFRVLNNHVHHCSLDYHGASGISAYRMKHSLIARNRVHDVGYFGIVLAGDQDRNWRFMTGNVVERNHIHHAMQGTQDGAALYVCFAHVGGNNFVRGNLIHDTSTNRASAGLYLDSHCTGVAFDRNVLYRHPSHQTHGGPIAADLSMALILNHKEDLAQNAWTRNLVLSQGEETPPTEFMEAMSAYAGLEPRYRQALEGSEPQWCELHVLADGVGTQMDFPKLKRGVVQLLRADVSHTRRGNVCLKLQNLDDDARYVLAVHVGQVQLTGAVGEGKLLFPMVRNIQSTQRLNLPEWAMGRDLMEQGLTLVDDTDVAWISYRQVDSNQ